MEGQSSCTTLSDFETLWNLKFCDGLQAGTRVERRNKQGFTLLEYAASGKCPDELIKKITGPLGTITKLYEIVPQSSLVQIVGHTILRLFSCHDETFVDVNYTLLIEKLQPDALVELLSVDLKNCWNIIYLLLDADAVEAIPLLVEMFNQLKSPDLVFSALTKCSQFADTTLRILTQPQLRSYLVNGDRTRLNSQQLVKLLMEPSPITGTVFYHLVQHNQLLDVFSLLATLPIDDQHSVLYKTVTEYGGQNLLGKASTERFLSILDLYAGYPEKRLQLLSSIYDRNTDPTIEGYFNPIREWITLYLLSLRSPCKTPGDQAVLDLKQSIANRLGVRMASAPEEPQDGSCLETTDISYRDMIIWACSLSSPERSAITAAISGLSQDTTTNRSLLQLIIMLEHKLSMDDWEFAHLINVVSNGYDHNGNSDFVDLLLNTIIRSSASSSWQALTSTGMLSSMPSKTRQCIKQACQSLDPSFIERIIEMVDSSVEFHSWLTECDYKGRSALSFSVGNEKTFMCLMQFYKKNKELFITYLKAPNIGLITLLHKVAEQADNMYVNELLDMMEVPQHDFNSFHAVIRNSELYPENLTVLGKAVKYGHVNSFQKLVMLYDGHAEELIELIQMRDSAGMKLIHHAVSQDTDVFIRCFISVLQNCGLHRVFESNHSAFQESIGYWGPFRALASYYEGHIAQLQSLVELSDDGSGSIIQKCVQQSDPAYIRTLHNIIPDFEFMHKQMKRLIPGKYKRCSALQSAVGFVFSFHAVLDFYSERKDEFFDLLSVKDKKMSDLERITKFMEYSDEKTALSYAAAANKPVFLTSLLDLHADFDKLHKLISSDVFFDMSLIHFTAWQNGPVDVLIEFYRDKPELQQLLTERGLVDLIRKCENGMTPFSVVTNILSIYSRANREPDAVKALLGSRSIELMQSSVFLNKYTPIVLSDYLAKVDQRTRRPLYKQHFEEKLRELEEKGEKETHSYRLLSKMLEWAEGRWRKDYTMPRAPSIVIIYNTKGRDGAEEEAQCLINALAAINLHVDVHQDINRGGMMEVITRAQSDQKCRSGQIVIIMSHGIEGCVCDNDGTPVKIQDIETAMAPSELSGCPKVLILQCCQKSLDRKPADPRFDPKPCGSVKIQEPSSKPPESKKYLEAPSQSVNENLVYSNVTSRDFIVIKSTVDGHLSRRNVFINTLARVFQTIDRDDDLVLVFNEVARLMENSDQNMDDQIPVLLMTAHLRFCLRGSFQNLLDDDVKTAQDCYSFIGLPAAIARAYHLSHPMVEGFDRWEKKTILDTLERSSKSERGENGMVVVLFAEGNVNHFHDNLNQPVFFIDVERAMTRSSYKDKPKIAIIHTNRSSHSKCEECDRLDQMHKSGVDIKAEYEPSALDFAAVLSHAAGKGSEYAIYLYMGLIWSEMKKLDPDANLLTAFGGSLESGLREAAGGGEDAYSFHLQVRSKLTKKFCLRALLPAYDFDKRDRIRLNLEQAERNFWGSGPDAQQNQSTRQMEPSPNSGKMNQELIDDDLD